MVTDARRDLAQREAALLDVDKQLKTATSEHEFLMNVAMPVRLGLAGMAKKVRFACARGGSTCHAHLGGTTGRRGEGRARACVCHPPACHHSRALEVVVVPALHHAPLAHTLCNYYCSCWTARA
ncbi:hypothetical protein EON66_08435 [archaeon]|nr:MAG: hypothetical protein EON66_08435 [archaeon]